MVEQDILLMVLETCKLLHFSKSITKLNKYINLDTKNLTDWLNISLNVQKNELLIFKH